MFKHSIPQLIKTKTVKTGIAGLIASVLIASGAIPPDQSNAVALGIVSLLGIFLRDAS